MSVNSTFSLTDVHLTRLKKIADEYGITSSEALRRMIDDKTVALFGTLNGG